MIWGFGSVLESASYFSVTEDIAKSILPLACATAAVIFVLIALYRGHFSRLDRFEWFIVAFDVIAICIWWYFESAMGANLFLVVTAVLSFIPIIRHTWMNPTHEDAMPWLTWSLAYFLMLVTVLLNVNQWQELVYPVVFLALHLIVGLIALDSRPLQRMINRTSYLRL